MLNANEARHQRMLATFSPGTGELSTTLLVRNHRLRTAEMDSMTPVDIPRVLGHDLTLKTRRVTAC